MCSFGNTWDIHLVNTSKTWDTSCVQPEVVVVEAVVVCGEIMVLMLVLSLLLFWLEGHDTEVIRNLVQ